MKKENFYLQTERLTLRQFELQDASGIYQLNSDPQVMIYAGDMPFASIDDAKSFIINYSDYDKYGMGRWTVLLTNNSQYCGWCGLKWNEELKEADIGFRLLQKFWNKGIASEASKACLQYGFEKLNLPSIIGRCRAENTASFKVLEKLGMKRIKTMEYLGGTSYLYRISLSEYQALTVT